MKTVQQQTIAIVQARMESSRLPGKVMLPLAKRPVLAHIYERLKYCKAIDQIVIATTSQISDQHIVDFCQNQGFEVFAFDGDVNDLLGRYISCGQYYSADIIVMVDGDCPLLHPPTVSRMVTALLEHPEADYAKLDSDSIEGGVAVLRLRCFERMAVLLEEECHREHATLYLMEHPECFSIIHLPADKRLCGLKHRLWLDTPADYRFLSTVYDQLYHPGQPVNLVDVVKWLRQDTALRSLNEHVMQKDVRASHQMLLIQCDVDVNAEKAIEIAQWFINRCNIAVRLIDAGMDVNARQTWLSAGISLIDGVNHPKTSLLKLVTAPAGMRILSLGFDGQPHIELGLDKEDSKIDSLLRNVTAYLGYKIGKSGYVDFDRFDAKEDNADKNLHCPLCGSKSFQSVWMHAKGIHNGICMNCGHVYLGKRGQTHFRHGYQSYHQYYPDQALLTLDNDQFTFAHERKKWLLSQCSNLPLSILEVGCAYGHFLSLFDSANRRVGIEPSHQQAYFARRYFGLSEIWNCGYDQFPFKNNQFDLICAFHVLEHLSNPLNFLRYIRHSLTDDGFLYVAVPELETLSPDLIELYFIHQNWHLHTFNATTLSIALARAGFKVIALQRETKRPMLRSSLRALARRSTEKLDIPELSTEHIASAQSTLARFHAQLDRGLQAIRNAFSRWAEQKRRLAIYGAGIHTRALLELSAVDLAGIDCLIDDDPEKQNTRLNGLPILGLKAALERPVDLVIVSSLASENKLLEELPQYLPKKIEIIGIYRDLISISD